MPRRVFAAGVAILAGLLVSAGAASAAPCASSGTHTVCFTSPAAGTTATGAITVTATSTATGDVAFWLDGVYLRSYSAAPFDLELDTTQFVDGDHVLKAGAYSGPFGGTPSATVSMVVSFANGVTSPVVPGTGFVPRTASIIGTGPIVVAAVGDGADGGTGAAAVVGLIDSWSPQMMLYLGDTYNNGTQAEFASAWGEATSTMFGRFKAITNPVAGNHEYNSNLAGYLWYWDSPPKWYATDAGAWKIVALDSNCSQAGGCAPGSPQHSWLESTLAAASDQCVIVMEHHPRLSTSSHGDTVAMDPFWRLMAQYGVELNLVGHEHNYQRWQPLDADLAVAEGGVTEFVVGTGGHGSYALESRTDARRVAGTTSYGALRLELYPTYATYQFVTTAGTVADAGTVACKGSAPDAQAPSVPTGVTVVEAAGGAMVSWLASTDDTGVAGYEILRDGVVVGTVYGSALAYVDGSLAPGVYAYTVRARDVAGNLSAPSVPVTFGMSSSVTATAKVAADTHVMADNATSNFGSSSSLRVDGSPVARGLLRFDLSSVTGSIRRATLTVWALNTSSHRGISVQASGDTSWTESGATWNQQPETPTLPLVSSDAIPAGPGYVSIDVTKLITGGGDRTLVLTTTSSSSISFSSREGGKPASLTVETAGSVPDTSAPTVPSDVVAVATSSSSVRVSWLASSDDVAVAGYEVLRDGVPVASVPATSLSFADTALAPSTVYSYAVRATDTSGNRSAESGPVPVTTAAIVALVAVADARVQADSPKSNFGTAKSLRSDGSPVARSFLRFDVSGVAGVITNATLRVWRLNTASHPGFSVHAVADTTWGETAITYNNQPAFTAAATVSTGAVAAGPAYVDLNITPLVTGNGLRSLMIATASSSSISIESREGSHKPTLILQTSAGDTTAPTVPTGVTAVATSATSASVSWSASFDAVGVAFYDVYRGATMVGSVAAPGTSFANAGLDAGSTYTFSVRARDAAGNASDASAGVPVTLVDTVKPSIPGGVTATPTSSSSVTVSWTASTDNWAVTAYNVYRGGLLAATVSAPGLSYVDGGRASSTTYTYTVRATDAALNESLDSTPLASAPTPASAPTTITLEPVADAYVDSSLPTANYGTSTQLRVDASPTVRAYLKFTVAGLSAPPSKVELRVYANNTSTYSAGFSAWRTANTTWTETGITYANAPGLVGAAVGSTGALPAAPGYRTIVVTPVITGDGTYSIALTTTSTTALSLASRQSTNRPQLVITT